MNKNESFANARINCEKPIYRNFHKTIDNTGFFIKRFLHFIKKQENKGVKYE